MKPKVPKETLKQWAEMTSNNDHRKVRESIAQWLYSNLDISFKFYVFMFNTMEFCVSQQQDGCPLPNGFLRSECSITDIMLNEVKNDYGCKQLYNQINKCL